MRKLTAAAIVAGTAGALAWPTSRRLIADVLITVGAHLEHADDDPVPSPAQRARMRDGMADAIAAALVRRGRDGDAVVHRHDTNGQHPTQPI